MRSHQRRRLRAASMAAALLASSVACQRHPALEIHRAAYEQHPGETAIKDRYGTTYFMSPHVELTGADIQGVEFISDKNGLPRIKITFTKGAGARFRELTRTHMKLPLVILLRGQAPTVLFVSEVATEDFTWIEGRVTEQDAKDLTAAVGG